MPKKYVFLIYASLFLLGHIYYFYGILNEVTNSIGLLPIVKANLRFMVILDFVLIANTYLLLRDREEKEK